MLKSRASRRAPLACLGESSAQDARRGWAWRIATVVTCNTSPVRTSSTPRRALPELPPETVEVLQAATRVLAGVALRSLDVLGGTVTLPQFRMLAVLADLGRARSVQVARALGLEASTVTRVAAAGRRRLRNQGQ